MKTLILAALVSSTAFAADNVCTTKQKNAASFALAQEIGVPVQAVEVIQFEPGMWTEATGSNTGSDTVTVRAGNRIIRSMAIKSYVIDAKQISNTADCNILKTTGLN